MWKFVCSNQSVWHNILQYTWILIQGIPKKCTFKVITKKKTKETFIIIIFLYFSSIFLCIFLIPFVQFFPIFLVFSYFAFFYYFHCDIPFHSYPTRCSQRKFLFNILSYKKTRKRLLKKFCLLKIKILKNYFLNIMSPKCDPPCSYTFSLRYPHKKNL